MKRVVCMGLLLLVGCTYGETDLYNRQQGKVRVALDWGALPVPDSAAFYFYPKGENTPLVRMSRGSGFEGTLAAGTYEVVVTNVDYSGLKVQAAAGYNGAFASANAAEGYTGRFDTRAAEPVLIESPQNLYGTGLGEVSVGEMGSVYIAYPQPLVYPVRLDIVIAGSITVREIEAVLSGVASSVHIPTGKPDFSEDAAVLFPLERQSEGKFRSSVAAFGLRPQANGQPQSNRLSLNIQMPDQPVFSTQLDITDLVEEAVENVVGGLIVATIELELTVDPSKPDGFNLELVGWHTGTGSAGEEE